MKKKLEKLYNYIGQLFLSYFSMLLIPFIIGAVAYFNVEHLILSQSEQIGNMVIEQFGNDLDRTLENAESISNTIMTNRRIRSYVTNTNSTLSNDIYNLLEISYDFRNYAISSEHAQSFFAYFPRRDTILTPTATYTPELFSKEVYQLVGTESEDFRSDILEKYYYGTVLPYKAISRENGNEYLIHAKTSPSGTAGEVGVNIFVFIDVSSIQSIFESFEKIRPGTMVTITSTVGAEILRMQTQPTELPLNDAKYLQNHLYSSACPDIVYSMWQPVDQIMMPIRNIRNVMLLLIVLYLIVGTSMSAILSEKVKAPVRSIFQTLQSYGYSRGLFASGTKKNYKEYVQSINQGIVYLADETKAAEQRLSQVIPVARSHFLNDMLQGAFSDSEELDSQNLLKYSLSFPYPWFYVLIIDKSQALGKWQEENIHNIVSQAAESIAKKYGIFYITNPSADECCIIMNTARETESDEIYILANEIREYLFQENGIDITICDGTSHFKLSGISESYKEAVQAKKLRSTMPGNGIYEFRSLHKPTNLIPFGTQIPLKLSNLIRAGNTQGACDIIDSLYTEYIIQGNIDPFMVHCLVMQILSLIIQISNNVGYQLQEGEVLPQNIRRLFELDIPVEDSNFILHSLCQNLCEYIIEKSNSSKTDLKMRIEEIVALELSNSSFNQVYLAEQLGVTAPYLSSFFKEKMGQNMVDYVNSRRCQLAQYYLSDTDKRISEIAQEVGFIDSAALIRVFKKYYGITPGQYRKNI